MKHKKIPLILCLCLLLIFSVGALVFFLNIPKNEDVPSTLDSFVTSVEYQQSGSGFFYSGGTEIVYVDENGEQKEAIDLSNETDGQRIYSLLALEEKDSLLAFADNAKAFLLKEEGDTLKLLGSFAFHGVPMQVVNDDKEFYIISQNGTYCEVKVYEYDNASNDYVRSGILYNFGGKSEGEGVALTLAKGLKIVNAFLAEDMLYVLHEGGIFKMHTSLRMNCFMSMTEEERTEAGVLRYNKNSFEVTITEDKFDSEALAIYTSGITAGCYREADGQIYLITNGRKLARYPLAKVGSQEIGSDLQLEIIQDVVLHSNETAKPAMFYDKKTEKGYLTFDIANDLVCIDFSTPEVFFTTPGQFDVRDVTTNADGSKVIMMYAGGKGANNEEMHLQTYDVEKQANKNLFRMCMYICIVLAVLTLLVTIFVAARTTNEKYDAKVKRTLKKMWKNRWVYVILIPSLAGLFMFCYYPGIASLGLSFFDYTAEKQSMKWNNFANYITIFTNKESLLAFKNMLIFTFADIITALIPPLTFAFFLTFMRSKGFSNFTRTTLFIPGVIPAIAGALIWKTGIYGQYGALNVIIELLGGEPVKFLSSSGTALGSIIMMGFPFVGSYLIFYGAIMNIADSYIEAAELEGCPLLRRLISIDIPLILPQIKYVLITTLIASAQNFNRVYMTTGGSWDTQIPINEMYNHVVAGNYGQSSAYAALLFLILFIPMFINLKTQKKGME